MDGEAVRGGGRIKKEDLFYVPVSELVPELVYFYQCHEVEPSLSTSFIQ
jgi:hypothetical protein